MLATICSSIKGTEEKKHCSNPYIYILIFIYNILGVCLSGYGRPPWGVRGSRWNDLFHPSVLSSISSSVPSWSIYSEGAEKGWNIDATKSGIQIVTTTRVTTTIGRDILFLLQRSWWQGTPLMNRTRSHVCCRKVDKVHICKPWRRCEGTRAVEGWWALLRILAWM